MGKSEFWQLAELCLSRVALSGPMAGGSVGPPPPLRKGGRGENNANVPRNLPVPLGTKVLLKVLNPPDSP